MAITIKGTGGLDTPSINATANAVFTGPVDFTQAVLKGVNKWQVVGSDTNLQSNRNYFANTRSASLTLTLPTSANVGDTIVVQDSEGFASSNNITINRNGNLIDGSARNAILNVDRGGIALTFESATNGFVTRKEQQETKFSGIQGEVSGFTSGGNASPRISTIEKFPFASDTNSVDTGDLLQNYEQSGGQSSLVSGYNSGGYFSPPGNVNNIEKFPFAISSGSTSSDIGDLSQIRRDHASQSSSVSGYNSGGQLPSGTSNVIDKFPFSTDTNATDVGDLTRSGRGMRGQSSTVNGYASGDEAVPSSNVIDKFPFASDANATDVGDLTAATKAGAGQSSTVSGYLSGGAAPGDSTNIVKFPFATDTNATDVGDLTQARQAVVGQSSTVSGYTGGGESQITIDKFSFVSDANATDVGDMSTGSQRAHASGQQV